MHKAGYIVAFLFGIVLFLTLSYLGLVNANLSSALKPITAIPQQMIQPVVDNYGTAIAGLGGSAIASVASKYFYDKMKKTSQAALNSKEATIRQLQTDHVTQTTDLANKVDGLHVQVEKAMEKQRLAEKMVENEKTISALRLERKQEEIDKLMAERKALSDLAAEKIIKKETYVH